jgi:excisionase family DNA binding protein
VTVSLPDHEPERERLLTPEEVAALFRVHPRTVGRWRRSGRLVAVRTPGGQYRHPESAVSALATAGVSA